MRRQARDRPGEALTLAGIGSVYAARGEADKALDYYQQALRIQEGLKNTWGQAAVLNRLGRVYAQSDDLDAASVHFERALRLWGELGDEQGKARLLYGLSGVERARNNLAAARGKIEEAVRIAETLRTKVYSQQLRISYLASVHDFFQAYEEICMDLYRQTSKSEYAALALQASERARAPSPTCCSAEDQRLRQVVKAQPAPPPASPTQVAEALRAGFELRPLPLTAEEAEAIKTRPPESRRTIRGDSRPHQNLYQPRLPLRGRTRR